MEEIKEEVTEVVEPVEDVPAEEVAE